jgi:post-segregation antitoxin (ccd killing protein)
MRMARVNVYLPDDLAGAARGAGLNVSALTQDAVRSALAARRTDAWLDGIVELNGPQVDVATVLAAVREARAELERGPE